MYACISTGCFRTHVRGHSGLRGRHADSRLRVPTGRRLRPRLRRRGLLGRPEPGRRTLGCRDHGLPRCAHAVADASRAGSQPSAGPSPRGPAPAQRHRRRHAHHRSQDRGRGRRNRDRGLDHHDRRPPRRAADLPPARQHGARERGLRPAANAHALELLPDRAHRRRRRAARSGRAVLAARQSRRSRRAPRVALLGAPGDRYEPRLRRSAAARAVAERRCDRRLEPAVRHGRDGGRAAHELASLRPARAVSPPGEPTAYARAVAGPAEQASRGRFPRRRPRRRSAPCASPAYARAPACSRGP